MGEVQPINNKAKTNSFKNRNGKIELLRFVFCMGVLLFHLLKYIVGEPTLDSIKLSLFPHGAMGVEFFFIVSGFLMAKSIFKKINTPSEDEKGKGELLSKEYVSFIFNKYKGFFTEHGVAFVITLISLIICEKYTGVKIITTVIGSIPNLFLIQMSGISLTNPNHVEWYLSCMIISMAILYPFCRKYYYTFTRYFAPLVSLLVLGYMQKTTGALTGVSVWMGICYKSMLRALCEVALGTTAFELSRYLSDLKFTPMKKLQLTAVEVLTFFGIMTYLLFTFSKKYEIVVLAMIFALVVLCFSGVTYGNKLFNNALVFHLGKISLPIYVSQLAAINFTKTYFSQEKASLQLVIAFALTVLIAYFVYFVSMFIRSRKHRSK